MADAAVLLSPRLQLPLLCPGAFLLRAFFGGNYWIGNPGYYQLAPAYGGTRWIRVGPDALLIRGYDGYVVRGIFY